MKPLPAVIKLGLSKVLDNLSALFYVLVRISSLMEAFRVLHNRLELLEHASDEKIKEYWQIWTFPLFLTDDFDDNWTAIQDETGPFIDSRGRRCRVVPQEGLAHCFDDQYCVFLYQAIVFSKAAYAIYIESQTPNDKAVRPGVLRRRLFIDKVLSRFPRLWCAAILKYDLHLYKVRKFRQGRHGTHSLYAPLKHPRNIRLLALLPTSEHTPYAEIRCLLGEESLDSCRPYTALSYVWGDANITRTIKVNDVTFEATKNLEAALRELRNSDGVVRILWIDAICINQQDNEEKQSQVGQMNVIYSNAEEVVVWLGNESFKTSVDFSQISALPILSTIPQHFPFRLEPFCAECSLPVHEQRDCRKDTNIRKLFKDWGTNIDDNLDPQTMQAVDELLREAPTPRYIHDEYTIGHLEAFTALLSHSWWKRVWVIQEFALASKITLRYGPQSVDWTTFRAILLTHVRMGQRSFSGLRKNPKTRIFRAFTSLARKTSEALPFFILPQSYGPAEANFRYRPSLAKLLALLTAFKATDPRDHIYALLGVLGEESEDKRWIVPDYTATTREIYTQFARRSIETTGGLNVLSARPRLSIQSAPESLPSWVPDWRVELPEDYTWSSISTGEFSTYRAIDSLSQTLGSINSAGGSILEKIERKGGDVYCASLRAQSPIPIRFSTGSEILYAHGTVVDVITEVGPSMKPGDVHDGGSSLETTLDRWKRICLTDEHVAYKHTGQPMKEVFWRSVLLDRYWEKMPDEWRIDGVTRLPTTLQKFNVDTYFGIEGDRPEHFPPENSSDEENIRKYLWQEHYEHMLYNRWSCHSIHQSFFKTEDGYVGICPPHALPGDLIVVLLGGTVPFVLRKFGEYHVIIGER
jgi:hypothetical protein